MTTIIRNLALALSLSAASAAAVPASAQIIPPHIAAQLVERAEQAQRARRAAQRPASRPADNGGPLEARRNTTITGGTGLTTSVTISRNGRIDGVNELHRWAWLTGKCGMTRLVVRDERGNVLSAREVFRGCANPRSRRVQSFSYQIPAGAARAARRVDIEHYHWDSNNMLKRAAHEIRIARDFIRENPEVVTAAVGAGAP